LFVRSLLKRCLFFSWLPLFSFFLSFFFVHIKHTYTSSDMKRQKDENDRQLSVNKMMNVRRRIYSRLFVCLSNAIINPKKKRILL
jgi:hypothetical protein